MEYDFKTLSGLDFEFLTRDLLQKKHGIFLESFKSGRDRGIDLRYSCSEDNKKIIVQCKHYVNTPYSNLKSHIKNIELPKIKKLLPSKYILATSIGLTPDNKDELYEILEDFCESTEDILGKDDLNNLIGQYPEIEKQHHKLWLTSTAVLDKLIHGWIYNQTENEIQQIHKKSKLYVQNEAYGRAMDMLEEHHFVILSGIPGIGKTTLAEMLILHYIANDFKLVKISQNISEASQSLDDKHFFYYDDFLGQTKLQDKLNKNEDEGLLRFIEAIRQKSKCRFVLTTREYILNQAKAIYEKISKEEFNYGKCIVALKDYDVNAKAHILYNHIYYSDLPIEYKIEFSNSKIWRSIINHKNYNPRIIQTMTCLPKIGEVKPEKYSEKFLQNLENPEEIWKHAYVHQINQSSRNLLLILYSLAGVEYYEILKACFNKYHQGVSKECNMPTSYLDIDNSLREIEGAFISISQNYGQMSVRYENPSIKDFIDNYIAAHIDLVIQMMPYFVYFKQLAFFWRNENLQAMLIKHIDALVDSIKCLIDTSCFKKTTTDKYISMQKVDTPFELRALMILDIYEKCQSVEIKSLMPSVVTRLSNYLNDYIEESDARDVLSFYCKFDGTEFLSDTGIKEYTESMRQYFFEKYESGPTLTNLDVLSDYVSYNDSIENKKQLEGYLDRFIDDDSYEEVKNSDISSEVSEYIGDFELLMKKNDIPKRQYEYAISNMHEIYDELAKHEEEEEDHDYRSRRDEQLIEKSEVEDIDSMFESLKDAF